jgi:hypothetical protein
MTTAKSSGSAHRHRDRGGWSKDQIKLAGMIARAAGWGDDTRKLVLRQLDGRAVVNGKPSSRSPRLTNADFEMYCSVAERSMGGQIVIRRADGSIYRQFPPGHFAGKVNDHLARMRRYVLAIAAGLEDVGLLNPDGAGLRGWIRARISDGQTDDIEQLDWPQLRALIDSLKAHARRHGHRPEPKPTQVAAPLGAQDVPF